MTVTALAFYVFASVTVAAGLFVVLARNPVHSVLWLILSFCSSAGLMVLLYAARGFTRILGAGHSPWIALVPWLWTRLDSIQPDEWLAHWIIAVIAMNGFSLIVDAIDVVRYIRGDRLPTVSI